VVFACVIGVSLVPIGQPRRETAGLSSSPSVSEAHAAGEAFLDRYVDGDGRVVRLDQGGDTVSEGQAYALLLAVVVDDHVRFQRIWNWTASHLQRPDGLLAWHWARGAVADDMPATDADLDAARALSLAASRFGEPAFAREAARIAGAILAWETVTVGGRLVLVAGPWARGAPGAEIAGVVNPSYFAPRTYERLAVVTGDPRWHSVLDTSASVVAALTSSSLPPNWATIGADGEIRAAAAPDGTPSPFGQDAARVPLRYAEDCRTAGRSVAARLWPRLQFLAHRSTIGLVAAAVSADAAGDIRSRDRLLDLASSSERAQPTYYGGAWVALGRAMLARQLLGPC
jgi:endoglucanase